MSVFHDQHQFDLTVAEVERLGAEINRRIVLIDKAKAQGYPEAAVCILNEVKVLQVRQDALMDSLRASIHETRLEIERLRAEHDRFAREGAFRRCFRWLGF